MCLRLGVPPSRLSEWGDSTDRAIIATHLMNEQSRCTGCGGYLDETTDRTTLQMVHETTCVRCLALAKHRATLEKAERDLDGVMLWADTVPTDET